MSTRATFFAQTCPTCGRKLRIRVEYLGQSVECQHCHALFAARDPALADDRAGPESDVMDAAERLLAQAERALASPDPIWKAARH